MRKSHATEALGVGQEVGAILAALHKNGYRTRKRPKQPVWIIAATPECYLLTYKPDAINTWVLYPESKDPNRYKLQKIIQGALSSIQSVGIVRRVS